MFGNKICAGVENVSLFHIILLSVFLFCLHKRHVSLTEWSVFAVHVRNSEKEFIMSLGLFIDLLCYVQVV